MAELLTTPFDQISFVVTDTETTGTHPGRDRLLEIAAVRVKGGDIEARFTQLIDPERSVPRRITDITGISTAMVFGKPRAHEVMPWYREFLADGVLVAHNLPFDQRFINSEFERARLPLLACHALCTLRLARRLLRGLRSKGLASVADFYGITIQGRHRALGDAEATAHCLIRFLDQLRQEHGVQTLEDLLTFQNRSYRQIKRAARHLERIRDEVLPSLPDAPGVYFMKDGRGTIIYIGKALSLRARVKSYFSAVEAHSSRMHQLVSAVRDVGWKTTTSELGALILESRLIKQHQPRFNRAQLAYRNRPFLKLDTRHPYPTLVASAVALPDGAEYFGPLAGRREVDFVRQIIDEFFGLRECDDATFAKGKPCMLASMGRCPHLPCELQDPDAYGAEVDRVRSFLAGEDNRILTFVEERMREASSRLEFERASEYRDALRRLQNLMSRRQQLATPVFHQSGVAIWKRQDDRRVALVIAHGRLLGEYDLDEETSETWSDLRAALARAREGKPQERYWKEEADELRLVQQWMHRNRTSIVEVALDGDRDLDTLTNQVRQAALAEPGHQRLKA